ncbi:BTAD domain-containing putative transcriptional regulator [Streptomyces sp. NPDC051985]|uniref:AfsR/SARP family transcriptional regulator n=1 Tax=Streptomyces sp. NPDC051985 TaxID=3155807 RepID=UPI003446B5A6
MTSVPLRFTVLGETRVWRDEVELDPGPPLRRTLLALLLARSGSPVPLPDIVEALWADRPPARAVNMVHRHVGRLRRLLEPELPNRAEGSLLLRGGGGYRLLAPAGSVDLARFRALVAAARDHGDPARAVEAYADALALRRGPAAGCPSSAPPHPVFTELDREYDAVVREAADLALRRGLAHRVLPALSESAVRHPLDEGLQALLVDALAATGRRTQALDVLRSTATRLTDELGVDPGPELTAARHRVTTEPATEPATAEAREEGGGREGGEGEHGWPEGEGEGEAEPDAAIRPAPHPTSPVPPEPAVPTGPTTPATPATPTATPSTPSTPSAPSSPLIRPAQLPPALTVFAGRTAELAHLRTLIQNTGNTPDPGTAPSTIATVRGPAGVGKTTLAVRLAHDVADRFPDGQLYVNLRGFDPAARPTRPEDALRGFLAALGVPPARMPEGLDARAALYRSLSAGRRLLVLLDNAREAAQVRPLLPGGPGCLVLVTSRSGLGGLTSADGARPVVLDVLSAAEARTALARRIGGARVAAEPRAVAEIVARTARLPLALAIVAARAAYRPAFPLAALAEQLRDAHGGLDAFRAADGGDDPVTDVRAVFSWSYEALGTGAARLFRLLALHPGPDLTADAAAALAGRAPARTRALLTELTDAHLLTEHAPGRYTCHDLLRAYATELVDAGEPEEERRAARHRMLDHYLHTAHAAALLFDPPTAAITPVAPAGPAVAPRPLADAAAALAWLTAERAVLLGVLRQAVVLGFDAHVWQLAWCLERFHERYGHWPEYLALQRTALEAAGRLADPAALAHAHRGLGRACMMLRRYDEADRRLRSALDLFGADDAHGRAQTHLSRWELLTRQGAYDEGLDELRPALSLYRASGNRRGQADVLVATAWGRACLGDARGALPHAHRALALFQELGIRLAEGYTWDTLGHVHRGLGRHRRSVSCHRRAVALFREAGDLFNEACALDRLGDAHHAAGSPGEALGAWRDARDALGDFDPVRAAEVRRKIERHRVRPPVTSQAHSLHCALPTLPPPDRGRPCP